MISCSNSGASSSRLLSRKGSSPLLLIWCRMIFSSRASLSFCWPFGASDLLQLLQTFASVAFRSKLSVELGLGTDFVLDLRLEAVRLRSTGIFSTLTWEFTDLRPAPCRQDTTIGRHTSEIPACGRPALSQLWGTLECVHVFASVDLRCKTQLHQLRHKLVTCSNYCTAVGTPS